MTSIELDLMYQPDYKSQAEVEIGIDSCGSQWSDGVNSILHSHLCNRSSDCTTQDALRCLAYALLPHIVDRKASPD